MRIAAACAALVLAAGAALAGCAVQVQGIVAPDPAALATPAPSPAPRPPGDVFADAQGRFDLVPPAVWTPDISGAQGTAVIFRDPQPTDSAAGWFSANINVLVVPSAADLPATVVGARQELHGLTDYRPMADEPVTLGDGTPAHLLGGTFSDSGFVLRNVQLFTVHERTTVVATGTSLVDAWGVYEPVFETSLRSLQVAT